MSEINLEADQNIFKNQYQHYSAICSNTSRIHDQESLYYNLNNFQIDKIRILNSNSFRRLQNKTQVFVNSQIDHYRNRMTHSIEVANISNIICKNLGLVEDLSELISLAHDLGHPPFGHAGERALKEACKDLYHFSHNEHSFLILTEIEKPFLEFSGLNLTLITLDGILKHNGPITDQKFLSDRIKNTIELQNLQLKNQASLEAQIAAISDDIGYLSHDLYDGIRADIITMQDLENLAEIKLISDFLNKIYKLDKFQLLSDKEKGNYIAYNIANYVRNYLIENIIKNISHNLTLNKIENYNDVINCQNKLVDFDDESKKIFIVIKKFLYNKFYFNEKILEKNYLAQNIIKDLVKLYINDINLIPETYRNNYDNNKMNMIIDYISCMTDRYALNEYKKYYNNKDIILLNL